jgi:hypothetical protein
VLGKSINRKASFPERIFCTKFSACTSTFTRIRRTGASTGTITNKKRRTRVQYTGLRQNLSSTVVYSSCIVYAKICAQFPPQSSDAPARGAPRASGPGRGSRRRGRRETCRRPVPGSSGSAPGGHGERLKKGPSTTLHQLYTTVHSCTQVYIK